MLSLFLVDYFIYTSPSLHQTSSSIIKQKVKAAIEIIWVWMINKKWTPYQLMEHKWYLLKVLFITLCTGVIWIKRFTEFKKKQIPAKSSNVLKALQHLFFSTEYLKRHYIVPILHQRVFPAESFKRREYVNHLLLLSCSKKSIKNKVY